MITFPTRVQSRCLNDSDGSLSLFIDISELEDRVKFAKITTEPEIDTQKMIVHHSADGKPVALEFRLNWWEAPAAGEPITLIFGN
jgi:hypothetical protein